MLYCVAEIFIDNDNKPVVRFRAKDNLFYWSTDIDDINVIWGDKESAERFCRLKCGRTVIPETWKHINE